MHEVKLLYNQLIKKLGEQKELGPILHKHAMVPSDESLMLKFSRVQKFLVKPFWGGGEIALFLVETKIKLFLIVFK